jgi:hypothetical protein
MDAMSPSDSTILERIHKMELTQARHDEKIDKLDKWVKDIHDSVKGLEKKASMAIGALVLAEIIIKLWR